MKTLEIIHLRLVGEHPQALVEALRESLETEADLTDARIYRHAQLDTDLAIHQHREGTDQINQPSDAGLRLAAFLREYGLVEHAVWIAAYQAGGDEEDVQKTRPPVGGFI